MCKIGDSDFAAQTRLFFLGSSRETGAPKELHHRRIPHPRLLVRQRTPRHGRKGAGPRAGAAGPAAPGVVPPEPGPQRRVSGALPRVPSPVVSPALAAMLDCAAAAAVAAKAAVAAEEGLEEELGV